MGDEIVALRRMNYLYPILDLLFLAFLIVLLAAKKKYSGLIFGLLGGVLYFIVDFGIFNMLLHTRHIENASMFWVLLWMSMSYGLTNFVWIWLWLDRDRDLLGFSILIPLWWIACPMMASSFGAKLPQFTIWRTTGSYHGIMAILLFVGYAFVICWNMFCKKENRVPILWILAIGVLVQFAWEFTLLIGGIRSAGGELVALTGWDKARTLIVNSLVETNLGLPYLYFIHKAFRKKYPSALPPLPPFRKAKNAAEPVEKNV